MGLTVNINKVVSPKKSATGNALQCNDPHLDTSRLPAIWYQYLHRSLKDGNIFIFPSPIMHITITITITATSSSPLPFYHQANHDQEYDQPSDV
jgi:hypothetical protein